MDGMRAADSIIGSHASSSGSTKASPAASPAKPVPNPRYAATSNNLVRNARRVDENVFLSTIPRLREGRKLRPLSEGRENCSRIWRRKASRWNVTTLLRLHRPQTNLPIPTLFPNFPTIRRNPPFTTQMPPMIAPTTLLCSLLHYPIPNHLRRPPLRQHLRSYQPKRRRHPMQPTCAPSTNSLRRWIWRISFRPAAHGDSLRHIKTCIS